MRGPLQRLPARAPAASLARLAFTCRGAVPPSAQTTESTGRTEAAIEAGSLGLLAAAALSGAASTAASSARWWLDRRRLDRWGAEWERVGPQWTSRKGGAARATGCGTCAPSCDPRRIPIAARAEGALPGGPVPGGGSTRSARGSVSMLTSLRPGGRNPRRPCGSHGVARLIREAGEVPRVRPRVPSRA